MIRLRSTSSGVTVVVPEEKAARLGPEWKPAAAPAPAKPKRSNK